MEPNYKKLISKIQGDLQAGRNVCLTNKELRTELGIGKLTQTAQSKVKSYLNQTGISVRFQTDLQLNYFTTNPSKKTDSAGRVSNQFKTEAVLKLLAGQSVEELSVQIARKPEVLRRWLTETVEGNSPLLINGQLRWLRA